MTKIDDLGVGIRTSPMPHTVMKATSSSLPETPASLTIPTAPDTANNIMGENRKAKATTPPTNRTAFLKVVSSITGPQSLQ